MIARQQKYWGNRVAAEPKLVAVILGILIATSSFASGIKGSSRAQRLYDFHMKDVTEATANGKACIVGQGVIDVPAVLKALVNLKFPCHVALEYETDWTAPMPGMKASFEYMRKVLA